MFSVESGRQVWTNCDIICKCKTMDNYEVKLMSHTFKGGVIGGLHYGGISQRSAHVFRQAFAAGQIDALHWAAVHGVGKQQYSPVRRFHIAVYATGLKIVAAVGLYIYAQFAHYFVVFDLVVVLFDFSAFPFYFADFLFTAVDLLALAAAAFLAAFSALSAARLLSSCCMALSITAEM